MAQVCVFFISHAPICKSCFFKSIRYISSLALIHMFEHKNPISYEPTMMILKEKEISFDLHVCTQKSDITRASYGLLDLLTRSCVWLLYFWHKFSFSFMSLALSFKIPIFWFHIRACSISFDSHIWAQKSDITRTNYQLLDLLTRPCVCLPDLHHKFAISIMSLSVSFKVSNFDSIS